jgi:hypothetical protein
MSTAQVAASADIDGRDDFDFLIGRWWVRHRRLQQRLQGDTRWDEFGGTCDVRPILEGIGNIDENFIDLPAGRYRAATLRLFNPSTQLWSIWWIDARKPGLEPPVHGGFEDGVGTFIGDDGWNGRPVRVRFIWSQITARSAHWEQAFSADGGASWETNWRMSFHRAD